MRPRTPDAVTVHQDAAVYATLLDPGESTTHHFRSRFGGYAFIVHGSAQLSVKENDGELDEGGAAKVVEEDSIEIRAGTSGAEALLVETRMKGSAG
jgi:redox-sensitive bicupin YhaK (pirin superfamily)